MTAAQLLAELRARGIELEPADGGLRVRAAAPPEPELREAIRRHKAELLALLAPPPLPAAVVELLLRHYAGDFTPRVRARLERVFTDNPPDAVERLQRAADYLGITGEGLAEAEARAMARHREVN
jgi:hypothetical protein